MATTETHFFWHPTLEKAELVRVLLDAGAHVNAKDAQRSQPCYSSMEAKPTRRWISTTTSARLSYYSILRRAASPKYTQPVWRDETRRCSVKPSFGVRSYDPFRKEVEKGVPTEVPTGHQTIQSTNRNEERRR